MKENQRRKRSRSAVLSSRKASGRPSPSESCQVAWDEERAASVRGAWERGRLARPAPALKSCGATLPGACRGGSSAVAPASATNPIALAIIVSFAERAIAVYLRIMEQFACRTPANPVAGFPGAERRLWTAGVVPDTCSVSALPPPRWERGRLARPRAGPSGRDRRYHGGRDGRAPRVLTVPGVCSLPDRSTRSGGLHPL